MKQIFPGLYQVPLTLSGFDPGSVNMYLIKTPGGLTAIDTGWDLPEALASLTEQLQEIGASRQDINEIFLTHFHIDHLGMVPRLKKEQTVKVYLHAKDLEFLKVRYTGIDNYLPMTDQFLQTHGFPVAELTPPEFQLPLPPEMNTIVPDVRLEGGEILQAGDYRFRVINTPGHTPGHVALYEESKKFLVSGDMLLPTIATNAAFHVQHIEYPMQHYLASLRKLKELEVDTVLPGHEYVFNNPAARIDELLADHAKKAAIILDILSDGQAKNAYQVSQVLAVSRRTRQSHWGQMNGWEKRFAVLQTVAHLKSLEYNKQVRLLNVDGQTYFKTVG
jgi:glyoxylase-like metal-dependent hydrolase (beta-lactamase superfamily II)